MSYRVNDTGVNAPIVLRVSGNRISVPVASQAVSGSIAHDTESTDSCQEETQAIANRNGAGNGCVL